MAESTDRTGRALIFSIAAVTISLLVLAIALFYNGYSTVRDQAEAGTSLAQQMKAACADPDKQTADIRALCRNATEVVDSGQVVGIKGEKGDPGAPGEPGPPPSDAQVANAVALYCAGGRCDGEDGRNASPEQVADAVATYCNARGECSGPRGVDGQDGPPGTPGPPPTDEQVMAAVATYCSTRNNCQGPPGPPGPTGEQGPVGVVDVETDCDAPDGEVVDTVRSSYDRERRVIHITCTYKTDSISPGNPIEP